MNPEDVEKLIQAGLVDCEVHVDGDGSHFNASVIGPIFAGKSLLQKQKLVYATVNEQIASGAIHALSIKTYTPEEWQRAKKLQVGR